MKVDNDSATYLWHYRLGHIGVKRMKKFHANGLFESLDYESFDTSEPCLMGKITKTPFSGTMEQANDLLEIIDTDVCGPMSVEVIRLNVSIIFDCSMPLYYPSRMFYMPLYAILYGFWD